MSEAASPTPTVALTIAGSDSGGGAGVQADLKTFAALGLHGASVISAMTAQNTSEVRGVRATAPGFVHLQIETVLDDLPVEAVKTGMLATASNILAVADFAHDGRLPNLVVDPVMVSSSGARLLDPLAEQTYLTDLFPFATVITPNCREAGVLLGRRITTPAEQIAAANELRHRTAARWVVVTGGDLQTVGNLGTDDEAIDIAVGPDCVLELRAPRVGTRNNHGTGCSFAAATAAYLALGHPPADALERSKQFVHRGLAAAAPWKLGAGHGPIDHFADINQLASLRGEREEPA
ncbi:MAG: bifunctional hydroxymethylpyrimidine kinase/phosphomethylpyrimidine kinase [Actinobacteria bacterium]|nr:bifunctional hydroxymethylpyrimidine kinase/phosphomethylpyrimidine kinase [Actinomycetota bacterium]